MNRLTFDENGRITNTLGDFDVPADPPAVLQKPYGN